MSLPPVLRPALPPALSPALHSILPASTRPVRFVKRGHIVSLRNVPPSRTLLEVLREDLGSTATKEGCGEGDCGACTVVLGEQVNGKLVYKAVNSCIRLAHSIDGMAIWTAEDIASDVAPADGPPTGGHGAPGERGASAAERGGPLLQLHPAQEAMVRCHGSQCGFCTPGFVMSMFAMYQNHVCKGQTITLELAQAELSGNLCRCTGYRPILDAAQQMAALPKVLLDESGLLQKLELLAPESIGLEADLIGETGYKSPVSLPALLKIRAQNPGAQIVAGTTDVGLWVTKQHRQFDQIIDVTRVAELRRIEDYPHHTAIGAAVTLNDAFAALIEVRPQLQHFAARFAGLSVRNSGTLGGNVAGGSPIGDSMPLLITLGASVVLMSEKNGKTGSREFALEDFYTGYKTNRLAGDEVLAWIKVPKPSPHELLRIYKISKRFDDDISAVCLGLNLRIDNGSVVTASIGVGGVAATPVRAMNTEAALAGKTWCQATVAAAIGVLRAEFSPMSDMRATSAYRTQVLGNLLQRFWLEGRGVQHINLQSFTLEAL